MADAALAERFDAARRESDPYVRFAGVFVLLIAEALAAEFDAVDRMVRAPLEKHLRDAEPPGRGVPHVWSFVEAVQVAVGERYGWDRVEGAAPAGETVTGFPVVRLTCRRRHRDPSAR